MEKPLAATLAEADGLIAAARRQRVQLQVGHIERYNRALRAAEPYLDGPRYIESLRLAPFQPRGTDVAVVLDLMIHDLDLVLHLTGGSTATEVRASGLPVLSSHLDIANARVEFANGAVALATASRVARERIRRLRLFQPNGYFSLDLASGEGEFMRVRTAGSRAPGESWPMWWSGSSSRRRRRTRCRSSCRASCTRSADSARSWSGARRAGLPSRWRSESRTRSGPRPSPSPLSDDPAEPTPRIFISAGEPSGDLHGAGVVRALLERYPGATIEALGGPQMEQAGAILRYQMEGLAAFGVVEVVTKIRAHYQLLRALQEDFRVGRYDLVVLVDYPGFHRESG